MESISHERPWYWSVRFGTSLWPWPWVRLGNHGRHKRKKECQGHGDDWEELTGKSLKEISGGNLFWRIKAICLWKWDWFGLVLYICSVFAFESVSRSQMCQKEQKEVWMSWICDKLLKFVISLPIAWRINFAQHIACLTFYPCSQALVSVTPPYYQMPS